MTADFDDGALPTMHKKDPRVLYETGRWQLVRHETSVGDTVQVLLHSYIAHACLGKGTYYWYSISSIDDKCFGCHNSPPDEIMGLWKLHNMDYIQKGISY